MGDPFFYSDLPRALVLSLAISLCSHFQARGVVCPDSVSLSIQGSGIEALEAATTLVIS